MTAAWSLRAIRTTLVAAVAKANPKTIVVVESGGAVLMPWASQVPAILEAFYPGIRGGPAIARILTGKVNPSGHLPITFLASPDQLAHPELPGHGLPGETPAQITYDEGAAVGYKWHDVKGYKPLWAFGHGLSYTSFAFTNLTAQPDGKAVKVSFSIRNIGKRAGKGVAQVYVAPADWKKAGWEAPKRLGAFAKTDLKPGQRKRCRGESRSAPARHLRGGQQQLAGSRREVTASCSANRLTGRCRPRK